MRINLDELFSDAVDFYDGECSTPISDQNISMIRSELEALASIKLFSPETRDNLETIISILIMYLREDVWEAIAFTTEAAKIRELIIEDFRS